jgi:hypothetical protein
MNERADALDVMKGQGRGTSSATRGRWSVLRPERIWWIRAD